MYNPPKIIKNPRLPVIVIAGGAGFLGSHLSELFLTQNFRVIIVDNLITGNKNFIAHLISHPRFAYLEHNLNTGLPEKLESADGIVHLLGEEIYLSGPDEIGLGSLLTNSLATYHLLELAKRSQAKFLIASSLNIYRGVVSATSLNQYFGPNLQDERLFSYNEGKRYAESLAWEYFKKFSLDIRVARLPETYGPRMDFKSTSNLGRLLNDLCQGSDLTVYGDGLDKDYYAYVSDIVEGLAAALTKPKTAGKIFNLVESKPITQLELAYLLKSLGLSGTQIIFRPSAQSKGGASTKEIDTNNLKEIGFKQKVKIREGLRMTLELMGFSPTKLGVKNEKETPQKHILNETSAKVPEGIFNKKLKASSLWPKNGLGAKLSKKAATYIILTVFFFLAPFIFVPPLGVVYNLARGYFELRSLEDNMNKLNLSQAAEAGQRLSLRLDKTRGNIYNLWLPNQIKKPYLHLTSGLRDVVQATSNLLLATEPALTYLLGLGPESKTPVTNKYPYLEAENGSALVGDSLDFLSFAEAELNDPSLKSLPKPLKALSEDVLNKMPVAKTAATSVRGLVQIIPELLGFATTKNYLVLLQNSNELRPTGGFIGSIVKISANSGRLSNPEIKDIYEIDGQIDNGKANIPAPKVIKDNLKTANLHIRDANYDPSFPQSNQKIKSLYEDVTGEKIDGIVAIDLDFVKAMIKILGPIFLSTYNESVTAENLFERAQFHSEANFSAGTSGKKTFLSILGQKFFEQLLDLPRDKYLEVGKSVFESLEEKHALIDLYLPSSAFISNLGFNGEIKNSPGDYLMIVDSNLGANKANYFVKRSVTYEAERSNRDGEVASILTVNYNHTGTSNAWPGGPYRNYLEVLLPLKASLTSAEKIDGGGSEEDITHQVEIDEQNNKTTFSYLFELPIGAKTSVVFRYILPPNAFPLNQKFYNLLVQKQPGTQGDPFRAKFVLPFDAESQDQLSQGFSRQGSSVIFEGTLKKDLNLMIPLSNK